VVTDTLVPAVTNEGDPGKTVVLPPQSNSYPLPVPRPVAAERFDLGPELARGGAAVVYLARDRDLDRDVAVKVILPEHAGRADLVERFREEAKVMARLQHPGIPPVHATGHLADGRPFLAMKLIRGQTLFHLLLDRPADPVARFLPAFEQVCQAIGYAHSLGVLHRDLKPGNIMIGPFGEAQVMDWGLAKFVSGPPCSALSDTPCTSPNPARTRLGSLLGTPAYMAPEQARGETERIDRRTDVFSLGAVLCEILTGSPPYAGDTTQVDGAALSGHLADALARLRDCSADPALVAIAVQCLDRDPANRPADGGAIATAVAAYRASVDARLRKAERDAAAAEEGRKKRKVQVAFALTLAAGLAAAGGVAWWFEHESKARAAAKAQADSDAEVAAAAARQGIIATLDQAEAALRNRNWAAADAALARADALLEATDPWTDLYERKWRLAASRQVVTALDAAEGRGQTWVVNRFDFASASAAYADAFRRLGIDVTEPAAAEKVRTSPIASRLQSGLEDWYACDADRAGLVGLLEQLDPHPKRVAIRRMYRERNAKALGELAATVDVADLTPQLAVLIAESSDLPKAKAIALLESVWRLHPQDFVLALALGNKLGDVPDRARDAIGYLRAVVALRPGNAAAWNNLGTLHVDVGQQAEALACYQKCVEIDPTHQYGRSNLGQTLFALGRHDEAEAELKTAATGDPTDPIPPLYLSRIYLKAGRKGELAETYKTLISLAPAYSASKPVTVNGLYGLGTTLMETKAHAEAELCLRRATELKPDWAEPRMNLGLAIQRQGRYAEAVDHIRAAHELGTKQKDWRYPSEKWLKDAEALAAKHAREVAPPPRVIE
jgi:tetratricopeptide (TPR) repeat protein